MLHMCLCELNHHWSRLRLVASWHNSSPLSAAYMRQWTGSALIKVMAWRQTGDNAALFLIGPLRTNFSEIWIKLQNVSFKKMHLKMSSPEWGPSCSRGDELTVRTMKSIYFHSPTRIWKSFLQNVAHTVQISMCHTTQHAQGHSPA